MDAFDGAIARIQKTVSSKGAFTDSFLDRIIEFVIVLGIQIGGLANSIPILLFFGTSMIISYVRARSESLDLNLSGVGLMERAERIILLIVALSLSVLLNFDNFLNLSLYVISILNIITIIQRTRYSMKKL